MIPQVGAYKDLLVSGSPESFVITEVLTETDASGAFLFTEADVAFAVEREAGNAFASVSGSENFYGYLLRGSASPELYALGFWDEEYGEWISVPAEKPLDVTKPMAWQAGEVTVMDGDVALQGVAVDVVLERVVPNAGGDGKVRQVFLHPNCDRADHRVYVTDSLGRVKWQHPTEGEILPRFPCGHGALGQRLTDLDPSTQAAPSEYLYKAYVYYRGARAELQEGANATLQAPGAEREITVAADQGLLVAPEGWPASSEGHGWLVSAGAPTAVTRRLPTGVQVGAVYYSIVSELPDFSKMPGIVSGLGDLVCGTCAQYVGTASGYIYGQHEPLSGIPIFCLDLIGGTWGQVATTNGAGYFTTSTPAYEPPFSAQYWVHHATWGTFPLIRYGDGTGAAWAGLGAKVSCGFFGYTADTIEYEDVSPCYAWSLPHVPWSGNVTIRRYNGETLVDSWECEESAWGGWITKQVIPLCVYQPNASYSSQPTGAEFYSFRCLINGQELGGTHEVVWEGPTEADSSGTLRVPGFGLAIGSSLSGDVLREGADIAHLEEARRVGLEHGRMQRPWRVYLRETESPWAAGGEAGRVCPVREAFGDQVACHAQALREPGSNRGRCSACGADARTYFETYPYARLSTS